MGRYRNKILPILYELKIVESKQTLKYFILKLQEVREMAYLRNTGQVPIHRIWCPGNICFNREHNGWPQPCPYRHKEYHWPGTIQPYTNTLIGDSIVKYVNELPDTYVQAYPGASIEAIIAKIQSGLIGLQNYRIIIFHVGSNNLHDENIQVGELYMIYKRLLTLVRRENHSAALVLSEIIPRTYENRNQLNKRMAVNRAIEHLCKQTYGAYFFRTYRAFIKEGTLRGDPIYYAQDGLHLGRMGTRAMWDSINGNIIILKGKLARNRK